MLPRLIAVAEGGRWTTLEVPEPSVPAVVEAVKVPEPAPVGIDALVAELTSIVIQIPSLPREHQRRMLSFLGSAYSLVHAKVTLAPSDQVTFERELRRAVARQ